ncbi:MAG: iron-containing alcohol dehydrogenase [Deltaproteobacteria bacterium]
MFLPNNYEFACPVKTNSGNRALEHLPVELDALNARKPLVITGKDAAGKGLVDVLIDAFRDSGITIGVFDGVPTSPDLILIRELFRIYRDGGYDAIIAVGGGSATDTAKTLNIAVSGEPEDLETCAGENLIKKPLKPLVYVPTLSGTGYETSRYAFFGNKVYTSHFLIPDLVVIDPRMTVPEDAKTTASTALVALTQAAELYVSPGKNPLTDSYAYTAISFIMENLVNVIKNPQESIGRLSLANAHCMAGCAFSNAAAGMAHTLGKAAGDACGASHGLCMGILLPYVLERYLSLSGYHIADLLLPLAGFDVYAGTAEEKKAQKAIDTIYGLQKDLFKISGGAIPRTLKDANVSKDILKNTAAKAAGGASSGLDSDGCLAVLEQAWEGR